MGGWGFQGAAGATIGGGRQIATGGGRERGDIFFNKKTILFSRV